MVDTLYTNGVIAVKEKSLLGERILRLAEMTAEEAFRALVEAGFGNGAEAAGAQDSELLCAAEERALDDFIRTYAPSERELEYLLSPRDFHNAKALVKAEKLGSSAESMLAPEGRIPLAILSKAIDERKFDSLGKTLGGATKTALEAEELTGVEIGAIFDNALFCHLSEISGKFGALKKMVCAKADMTNILTAVRAGEQEFAEKLYVEGGKLTARQLSGIFEPDREKAAHALDGTAYKEFYSLLLSAKGKGLPFTEAEKRLESSEAEHFAERKYELERKEPFLYYVFCRRAEIANVRIVLVCLNAGLKEQDIKRRLRAV